METSHSTSKSGFFMSQLVFPTRLQKVFFISYLGVSPILRSLTRGSITQSLLINDSNLLNLIHKGHWDVHNEAGSELPVNHISKILSENLQVLCEYIIILSQLPKIGLFKVNGLSPI